VSTPGDVQRDLHPDGYQSVHADDGKGGLLRGFMRGEGPAIVMVPGIARPISDLVPLADRLVHAGYAVLLAEVRGIGRSTGDLSGITLHDLASDVASLIHASGLPTPVIAAGHAFGNRVVRTLATDHPELVRAVLLLSCSGKVHSSAEMAEANRIALSDEASASERRSAAAIAWFGPGADVTPWLTGWHMEARQAFVEAARATPLDEFWRAGQAEVLIVQGLADFSAPAENGRMLKSELGARATLVELEGVGHSLPVEAPDRVAEVILQYLRYLRGSASA